jgi:hypothetical protein
MKRITTIAHLVAVTLIATGCALAQDHLVQATVPFAFNINGSSLPAGTYKVGSDFGRANMLSIKNREQSVNIWAIGMVDSNDPSKTASLVFHRYGDQYFLSEIHYANSSSKLHFPASKTEKRVREHTLEAGLPANSDVLIALN